MSPSTRAITTTRTSTPMNVESQSHTINPNNFDVLGFMIIVGFAGCLCLISAFSD